MATYYGTYGQKVQYLSSDPPAPQLGQVWYNSTSATLKVRSATAASWASGGNMNTARYQATNFGTQTSALANGGQSPTQTTSEIYNGTSWSPTTGSNIPRAGACSFGESSSSGVIVGGYRSGGGFEDNQTTNETWNGSSWTQNPVTNFRHGSNGGAGTATSGLVAGYTPGPNNNNKSESWNGSSWTNTPNLNTGSDEKMVAGTTQTAALAFASAPIPLNGTESWNGSTWTTIPGGTMNQSGVASRMAFGSQSLAGCFAGYDPATSGNISNTELWNGSTWSSSTNGPTAYRAGGSCGLQAAGLFNGGVAPNYPAGQTSTFEFNGPSVSTQTVTVS